MTGPEHYREAERLEQLAIVQFEKDKYSPLPQLTMQQAQVHATLAQSAAVIEAALAVQAGGVSPEWEEVAS